MNTTTEPPFNLLNPKEILLTDYDYEPRRIGSNWLPCCICRTGGRDSVQPDMAAFVKSKDEGERIVALFGLYGVNARLDYREHEPNWVQVKLGACSKHLPFLEALLAAIKNNNVLNADIIALALHESGAERDRLTIEEVSVWDEIDTLFEETRSELNLSLGMEYSSISDWHVDITPRRNHPSAREYGLWKGWDVTRVGALKKVLQAARDGIAEYNKTTNSLPESSSKP